ncbi:small subunit ribosomal protein S4 [Clostridium acetobutylicum]|uniref:Small ribosomal subunit protein uS4A n=1 Tax=Clostridium acetobutylicum (strain ATCC 824 / DSM 792 / JCM 1419 / IAM 19013 / LMG 5710 / NBRC 13948 / NRRL B-527 / VKM B-1787 / 2291 / W) TaxID=272562 RepID=RS4A_CLOAB|nr:MULTISPECIES: 30S ribosomal protein S4 [Clostridium]Q97EK5.1 RecName: Full=Small ribosomal subunit protein uS4A; AltName: Full=30S ribosomal protein S4 1 [Clostridium acetobutylicum ATCC 824]AAK81045.1 Ribosomal protein S4 [Clostridium acetobutylicum ATCC 824]ADZ22148.1 30S ribosomal protein S4 [Clostridium acetobutylicum EA 2018]AEI33156.1 30S ribosomal protein S4 [Clostridium acetobutylicum DSM 1731]AWV78544.1 30S ribosomal protein S4 [Clostridium acetobutylicum]KHD35704.1 30S ribosomal 
MARYTGAVCRLCRREGLKLFLKGDRCYTDKCAFTRRGYAPGVHGQSRKKISNYGLQLREKQKAKRIYGVLEKQFRIYYKRAERIKGISGENLLKLLELRLDNVAYKLGYGSSRKEARQLVTHGHFLVNGKKVDIPSYTLKVNEVVSVSEKSRGTEKFKTFAENPKTLPAWIEANYDNFEAKIVAEPNREDIDTPIKETLIVELYSK